MDGYLEVCASAGRLCHTKRIMCFAKEVVEDLQNSTGEAVMPGPGQAKIQDC